MIKKLLIAESAQAGGEEIKDGSNSVDRDMLKSSLKWVAIGALFLGAVYLVLYMIRR